MSIMTRKEMIDLINKDDLSAAMICKEKYIRLKQAFIDGNELNQDMMKADTCALCYEHDGECRYCGIYKETDVECSMNNGSEWGELIGAIEDYNCAEEEDKADYYSEVMIRFGKMINLLDRIEENDSDEKDEREECSDCGYKIDEGYENWVDDYCYCNDCYNDKFTECDECGAEIERTEANWVHNDCYCTKCYNKKYSYCTECDQDIDKEDMVKVEEEDKEVCKWCYADLYEEEEPEEEPEETPIPQ